MMWTMRTTDDLQALRLAMGDIRQLTDELGAGELLGLLEPEVDPRLRRAAAGILQRVCALQMILGDMDEALVNLLGSFNVDSAREALAGIHDREMMDDMENWELEQALKAAGGSDAAA